MDRVLAILATIAVGGLIAFQAPVNAQLSRHVGAIGAALVSTSVAAVVLLLVYVAAKGGFGELGALGRTPWHQMTGGLLGAALVIVALTTVRTLGAGGVTAAMVAGQLVVAALLDRFGVLGLDRVGLTPARLTGFALLIAAVVLITRR